MHEFDSDFILYYFLIVSLKHTCELSALSECGFVLGCIEIWPWVNERIPFFETKAEYWKAQLQFESRQNGVCVLSHMMGYWLEGKRGHSHVLLETILFFSLSKRFILSRKIKKKKHTFRPKPKNSPAIVVRSLTKVILIDMKAKAPRNMLTERHANSSPSISPFQCQPGSLVEVRLQEARIWMMPLGTRSSGKMAVRENKFEKMTLNILIFCE